LARAPGATAATATAVPSRAATANNPRADLLTAPESETSTCTKMFDNLDSF
jgi:hypothetical protein